MTRRYKIGDVCALVGIPHHVLRFYEKYGIIQPARGKGNYRYYFETDLYRLVMARSYRGMGFGLRQCKELMDEMDAPERAKALTDQLTGVRAEIDRLRRLEDNLHRRIQDMSDAECPERGCFRAYMGAAYWVFSHDQERRVDPGRLDAKLLRRVMEPVLAPNMDAHVPVRELLGEGAMTYAWGQSFHQMDCDLLEPDDLARMRFVPGREYVVCAMPPEMPDGRLVRAQFAPQLAYARSHGLTVGDTAIARIVGGGRKGQTVAGMRLLCYLPVAE